MHYNYNSKDISIKKSNIHGYGIFSNKKLPLNFYIGVGIYHIFFDLIPVISKCPGSMINHSYSPNCKLRFIPKKKEYIIITSKPIKKNEELTLNYNDTPWYIDKPKSWYK